MELGEIRKFRLKDARGKYTGSPGMIIDVNLVVREELYVIEVKPYAELDDLEWLVDKVALVERVLKGKTGGLPDRT